MSCRRRRLKALGDKETDRRQNERHRQNHSLDASAATSSTFGTNAKNDKKVVEWWRKHQHENDEGVGNDFAQEKERINFIAGANVYEEQQMDEHTLPGDIISPFATNTIERNQIPMQDRPYNGTHQDFMVEPKNGMVLDPRMLPQESDQNRKYSENPSLGVFTTKGRSDRNKKIEFFQPELVPTSRKTHQKWEAQNMSQSAPSKREYTGQREEEVKGSFSNIAANQEMCVGSFPTFPDDFSLTDKRRKKQSLSQFMARKSKKSLAANKAANTIEFSDHLSDVPSDVDSITRERYLLACQMLKMAIIKKESALVPVEKKYILSLMDDFESHSVDGSELSQDHVSSIEHAILKLERDSISPFQEDNVNDFLPSPTTAARAHMIQKAADQRAADKEAIGKKAVEVVLADTHLPRRSDKNPHTATRKPKNFREHIFNSCNPINPTKTLGRKNHQPREKVDLDSDTSSENRMFTPYGETDRLVRFDGWSFQNSMEYPFSIIDADRNNTNRRVFTPGMMEALRGFMPMKLMNHNFWLRFSLAREGASFTALLASVRASTYTVIGVETDRGEVFGSFTGKPWRIGSKWYGSSDSFLWRLKQMRYTSPKNSRNPNFEREMEVYPCTGDDDLIQYCTAKTLAIGGGEWQQNSCPYRNSGEGIGLVIDGDLAGGETNSCATFANPKLARHASLSSEFVISNLEIWSLTPSTNTEDATKREMRNFFVNM